VCSAIPRVLAENGVHPIPEGAFDNGFVLAGICRALVNGLAHVDPVVEQLVDIALVDNLRRRLFPRRRDDAFPA
jgi:hypothetical protein